MRQNKIRTESNVLVVVLVLLSSTFEVLLELEQVLLVTEGLLLQAAKGQKSAGQSGVSRRSFSIQTHLLVL